MTDTKSPFKFLDPYELKDKAIFFGRDTEIEELYKMVFQTNLLLVYGQSGTGKTSLIQCGLAGRFNKTDWFDIFIRRRNNINDSLRKALQSSARTEFDPSASLPEMVESLYLDYFRPIYLLFDQFEELFILGTKDEQEQFIIDIAGLLRADLSCKIIFVLREEYLAHLYNFETVVPALFNKRLRVEPMGFANVEQVIQGSCAAYDICLEPQQGTIRKIIDKISDGKSGVQLSYLQVYLDELWQEADHSGEEVEFTPALVEKVGDIGDVLAEFLEEQTSKTQAELEKAFPEALPSATRHVLNAFATLEGTKKPLLKDEIPQAQITVQQLSFILERLERARILREADSIYELSHDTLARRIADQRSVEEVTLLEVVKLVQDREKVFERTRTYLNAKELQLVETQEETLRQRGKLTEPQWNYLSASKRNHRQLRRRTRLTVGAIMAILVLFSIYSWKMKLDADENERLANEKTLEANSNLAKLFEEKAGYALASQNYQEAWLYNLQALYQEIGKGRIPVSLGRLMRPEIRPSTGYFKGVYDVSDQVRAMDIDAAGQLLAVGALKQIEIWDTKKRKKTDSLSVWLGPGDQLNIGAKPATNYSQEEIWDLAYNPARRQLAFCLSSEKKWKNRGQELVTNQVIFLWDLKKRGAERFQFLSGHGDDVKNLIYSPDGKVLASSAYDGKILLWDEKNKAVELENTQDTITCLAFSPDSKLLAAGYLNGNVKIWDLTEGRGVPRELPLHRNSVRKIFFMPGGKLLASGSELGQIVVYDLVNGKNYFQWTAHNGAVNNLNSSPDSSFLISTSPNRLRFWDWKQRDSLPILQVDIRGSVSDLMLSASQKQMFTGTLDKKVRVLDLSLDLFEGNTEPLLLDLESFISDPQSPANRKRLAGIYNASMNKLPYTLQETNLELSSSALLDSVKIAYYGAGRISERLYQFIENNTLFYSKSAGFPKFLRNSIELTPDEANQGSALFLKPDLVPPFEISFEYAIRNAGGAYGESYDWKEWPADGLVFMFFKNRSAYSNDNVPNGGSRGFLSDGTGYGLHFATFNTNDIFLVDGKENVLASYSSFQRKKVQPEVYSGDNWRRVNVRVTKNSVTVRYEAELAFIWEGGDLDQTFKGIGFGAATGGASSQHEIRNILVETNISSIADISIQNPKRARINGNRVNVRTAPEVSDNLTGHQFRKDDEVDILESRVVSDDRTLICKKTAVLELEREEPLVLGNGVAVTRLDTRRNREGYYYVEADLKTKGVKRGWIKTDQVQAKSATGERWYKVRKDKVMGWVFGQFVEPI